MKPLPQTMFSGIRSEGHVQGIAVDQVNGFVYYSFTTVLLKTDLTGKLLGSVTHLAGHLGCIAFCEEDGCVYGSLELKHDKIGKGIIRRTGWNPSEEDSFYLVRFDVSKIHRENMDAETDGVMTAVYLSDVVKDYTEQDESGHAHRYGCSGIDGVSFGPVFGAEGDSPKKLMVCYGVYGDVEREDNDYQVILQYDPSLFAHYARPLDQANPHHNGPKTCEERYFLFTGNTCYGIQNLEYDAASRLWLTAVYVGKKPQYPNFHMFLIDGRIPPARLPLLGRNGEEGLCLTLAERTSSRAANGVRGFDFPYGDTGIASLGDGYFYFSQPMSDKEKSTYSSKVVMYRMTEQGEELFEEVSRSNHREKKAKNFKKGIDFHK